MVVDEAYVDFGGETAAPPRGEVPERPRRAHLFQSPPLLAGARLATPWAPRSS